MPATARRKAATTPSATNRRQSFYRFHFLLAGGLAVLGTVLLWWLLSGQWTWYHWLGSWLVAINVLTFGYYGYDKGRSRSQRSRIPEVLLHTLTAIGGSLGAFLGMHVFRHKTIKGKFRILFWCIVTLQTLLALLILKMLWLARCSPFTSPPPFPLTPVR